MRSRTTNTEAPTLAPIMTAREVGLDGDEVLVGSGVGVGVTVVVDAAERKDTVVTGVGVAMLCELVGLVKHEVVTNYQRKSQYSPPSYNSPPMRWNHYNKTNHPSPDTSTLPAHSSGHH